VPSGNYGVTLNRNVERQGCYTRARHMGDWNLPASSPVSDFLVVLLESVSLAIRGMAILSSLMWASWIVTWAVVALYWAPRIARYAFRKDGAHRDERTKGRSATYLSPSN
jgi:hypothetical protein